MYKVLLQTSYSNLKLKLIIFSYTEFMNYPKIKLNAKTEIPVLGLGTWQLKGDECAQAVKTALSVGYRHLDTAAVYDNQETIGQTLKELEFNREDLFITSKLWLGNYTQDKVYGACEKTLKDLQTDYLDLYLIHWPDRSIPVSETLNAMQELKNQGLIKAIGVSNFNTHHLQDALKTGVEIGNNQVEFHPSLYQEDLKDFCDQNKIVLTAYSPLAQGEDLKLELIKNLSKKYGKSPAQVVLNWILSKNMVAIPRSANPNHIKDNFKTLEWQIDKKDLKKIDKLNKNNRILEPGFADFDY